ncbi:hypothetical protein ACI4CV_27220, partial [Klebsiella pneumoniae]|uniref:hypothetical protein n=1 Tax=Klebsiella pneumoniae TaxID=573 RepID=UPI00385206E2
MSKYDINQLRKLTTDKEWLLAMVIATFDSAELINLLISCPNLVQDYEALYGSLDDKKSAYSIQSPLMLIRDAYNG